MSVCGTWRIGWPSPVNIETTRLSNGNCGHLGIPKRPTYYAASESVRGWIACVPKLLSWRGRGDRFRGAQRDRRLDQSGQLRNRAGAM
jgi:hypothetical protein